MWTVKERAYLALGFIAAALAAYGALQGSFGLFEPPSSLPLAIAVMVFAAVLGFMVRAIEAIRDERIRNDLDVLFRQEKDGP